MDLRHLRYALAVVDEGTFTAAATACESDGWATWQAAAAAVKVPASTTAMA